jgi:ribonuclease J
MNLKKHKDELLFLPLGGSGEIGMNLNLYHLDGKWIMVDCGIGFADDYYPGAEIIVPNIKFIERIKPDLLGLVVTHAHEDHVGGIPYLWEQLECPVYTTAFTANFLRLKLLETAFGKRVKINEIKPGQRFTIGPFEIDPINLTHSIPEMHAMAIHTRHGLVLHTGDWKFDKNPMVGPAGNLAALKTKGNEGVLAMVCDSTNVFSKGESGSEMDVRENLIKLVGQCKNRVALGTFASNLARVESILAAAKANNRDVVVCGRSFWRLIEAATESGYLRDAPKFFNEKDAGKIPRQRALYLCTGSQAEPRAALSRIAEGTHPHLKLLPGDTAILSSKIIPGNDNAIYRMLNLLTLQGVEVITEKEAHIHVSGHPYRNELKEMYEYIKPQIAIPVHGEARHIHEHAKLAKSLGVPEAFEIKNGDVLKLAPGKHEKIAMVEAGKLAIDAFAFLAGDSIIMRSRRKLKIAGVVLVSVVMNNKGICLAPPRISAPGLLDPEQDGELYAELSEEVSFAVDKKRDLRDAEEAARKAVRRIIRDELDKNPIIEVHITRVN